MFLDINDLYDEILSKDLSIANNKDVNIYDGEIMISYLDNERVKNDKKLLSNLLFDLNIEDDYMLFSSNCEIIIKK